MFWKHLWASLWCILRQYLASSHVALLFTARNYQVWGAGVILMKLNFIICHWRHYLVHREFLIFTIHDPLKHLDSKVKVSAQHDNFIAYLYQFTFTIRWKAGKLNHVADALAVTIVCWSLYMLPILRNGVTLGEIGIQGWFWWMSYVGAETRI